MSAKDSATVKQFRRNMANIRELLSEDLESPETKRKEAQRSLLIATASDEELEEMAKLEAFFFHMPLDKALKHLRKMRDKHRKTVPSWRENLGKLAWPEGESNGKDKDDKR